MTAWAVEVEESGGARLGWRGQALELLSPDIVLPEQFHDEGEGGIAPSGPRGLMLAILEDAIWCASEIASPSAAKRMEAHQAEAWISSRDTSWLFSFESICAALDLEPETLRRRIATALSEIATARSGRRRSSHRVERGERRKRSVNGHIGAAAASGSLRPALRKGSESSPNGAAARPSDDITLQGWAAAARMAD
jgi:hypothetical protein